MTNIINDSLRSLARGDAVDVKSYLNNIETHFDIAGCKFIWHCHSIKLDGNGRPRVNAFIEFLTGCVLDYAIPRSSINEAFDEFGKTKSSNKVMLLHNQARELFTSIINSGEGGELLLFVLAERILNLPQLLCKMDFKTNTQMHIHGLDGIHVGYDTTASKLNLYYGESKLHKTPNGAITECISSLAPYLLSNGGTNSKSKRDLQLLSRHLDLDKPDLEAALVAYFDPQKDEYNSMEIMGLCLVGFDCESYPTHANSNKLEDEVIADVAKLAPDWRTTFSSKAISQNIASFKGHAFCVPFPDIDSFRKEFKKQLGI